MKLTDTLAEQEVLESLIDDTKPKIPNECSGLHFLLYSPLQVRTLSARLQVQTTRNDPWRVLLLREILDGHR